MFKYNFNRLEELYILAKRFGIDTKQPVSKTLDNLDILDRMIWDHWMFSDPNETEIEQFINKHFVLKMFRTAFHEVLENILNDLDEGYREFQRHMMQENDALTIARLYGLENEVQTCLDNGMTCDEALKEWDLC